MAPNSYESILDAQGGTTLIPSEDKSSHKRSHTLSDACGIVIVSNNVRAGKPIRFLFVLYSKFQ